MSWKHEQLLNFCRWIILLGLSTKHFHWCSLILTPYQQDEVVRTSTRYPFNGWENQRPQEGVVIQLLAQCCREVVQQSRLTRLSRPPGLSRCSWQSRPQAWLSASHPDGRQSWLLQHFHLETSMELMQVWHTCAPSAVCILICSHLASTWLLSSESAQRSP